MLIFFAAGVALAVAAHLAIALVGGWQQRRIHSPTPAESSERRPENVPQTEPTLAELLAETGWRINPDERQREFARKSVSLLVTMILAVLLLIAGNGLGWLLVGCVVGWALSNQILTVF